MTARRPPPVDSIPVEQRPPDQWQVPDELDGALLDRAVRARLADVSWNRVRSWIEQGKIALNGALVFESQRTVGAGDALEFFPTGQRHAGPKSDVPWIVHRDSQVVVVDKPAGVATVPYENSERDSLDRRVASVLGAKGRSAAIHVVHRLDKETSGLLVFARTDAALKSLKNQFRFHTTHRRYLAIVHGRARSVTYKSRLIQDRGDGIRGSTNHPELGREAITHVRVLEVRGELSLIECELETGRTHQIRIHLSEAGHPLVGERVYSRGYAGELEAAPRLLLHAAELGFDHPTEHQRLEYRQDPPEDFLTFWAARAPAGVKSHFLPLPQSARAAGASSGEARSKSPEMSAPRTPAPRTNQERAAARPSFKTSRPQQGGSRDSSRSASGKRSQSPPPRTSGKRRG